MDAHLTSLLAVQAGATASLCAPRAPLLRMRPQAAHCLARSLNDACAMRSAMLLVAPVPHHTAPATATRHISTRLPLPPRSAASGAANPDDSAGKKNQPDPFASIEVVHPEGFVARRLLVFAGILVAYTCL